MFKIAKVHEDREYEEYLNVRLIERLWEINETEMNERTRKWVRQVRRYWKRRKKESKRKKNARNEIEKNNEKRSIKRKNKKWWIVEKKKDRNRVRIYWEWDWRNRGKRGENNGERKKGNWGRDRKMQITSWGVRSKLKRGIERGYKKRDRERDKQASLRNQYDADSSSIYLVQRPPP